MRTIVIQGNRRRAPRGWTRSNLVQGHRLGRDDVMSRIRDHGPNHYSGLYNVMKGVSLAGAGLALVRLAGQDFPTLRIVLVVVALIGVFLTYYGQTVGLVIVHIRPSILDIALPMLLTVLELYIAYRPGIERGGSLPVDWFGGLAIWALLAASVIASIAQRLERSNYAPALWSVAEDYKAELREDIRAASGLAFVTVLFVVVKITLGTPAVVDYIFLAGVIFVLCMGINSQGRTRLALSQKLDLEI